MPKWSFLEAVYPEHRGDESGDERNDEGSDTCHVWCMLQGFHGAVNGDDSFDMSGDTGVSGDVSVIEYTI